MTGTQMEKKFVAQATDMGYVCRKLDQLSKSDPDTLVMGCDRKWLIEFKSRNEEVKGHQKKRHREFKEKGVGHVVVCRDWGHAVGILGLLEALKEEWNAKSTD